MSLSPKIRLITTAPPATRLTSWKEIASYLGRDARTAQLWEKQEGLPIHRHTHRARASVYAYPEELDAWLQERRPGNSFQENIALENTAESETSAPIRRRSLHLPASRWPWVAALLLAVLGTGFWMEKLRDASPRPPAGMLAVLPFEDLSSSQDYLVDGLTDSLITDLGRAGQIPVISRRSVMQFKGQHLPLPQIAGKLHAALLLEGTVTRSGDEMRVTAQLVDAEHDRNLWASSYSRKTTDLLAFEDEIASTIAAEVTQKLTGATPPASAEIKSVDPRVRLAYLTGRYFWNQRDKEGLRKSITYYQQAADLDPRYAPAYVGLADSFNLLAVWDQFPNGEGYTRAKAAAQTALTLDPASAEAYNSLAFATYRQDWDFNRADQYFRKAIELNPNYAVAHQWYGEFLGDMRRFDQSIAELLKARELDPLSAMVGCDLADGYLHAGRLNEAVAELKRVQNLYPDFLPAHVYMVGVYSRMANYAAAQSEAQAYFERTGDDNALQMVRIEREAAAGQLDQARRDVGLLLKRKSGISFIPYQKAQLFFASGQKDAGYAALEEAYREHSWWLVTMRVDPGFDIVQNDPRFREIARRVGLAT
jgi:TolB-like protein/Tfp pilus assembly protein PilF